MTHALINFAKNIG